MISPGNYQRVRELFLQCADLDRAARAELLDRECVGDSDLRTEVERLLERDRDTPARLKTDGLGGATDGFAGMTTIASDIARSPDPDLNRVGNFTLLRVIGSGGMGTVYEAEQSVPRRAVALKIMRAGLGSRSATRRFELEAQLLASLRHPGIAQVYEVGQHEHAGGLLPYFAMELIPDAVTLTEFATRRSLGTRDRVELFLQVCGAVHIGHERGVIHRDLKPGNVLVDGAGRAKIIDFGVARCTDADLAITTLRTDVGQLIGTLQYMSPEQCEADPDRIDARTDVYALGMILYELLTGQLAYDVSRCGMHDAAQRIRTEAPRKPSTLDRRLRGDIETIVLKALEKEPERRYTSAADLADDLKRYLRSEPISARPASVSYQVRAFARRHRGLVASIVTVFVVLVAATVTSSILYVRAESARSEVAAERDRAIRAESSAVQAKDRARAERDVAERVTDFMVHLFEVPDPGESRGNTITARQVLDRGVREIGEELQDQPRVRAAMLVAMGRTYVNLGLYKEALPLLEEAVSICDERDDIDALLKAKALDELATLQTWNGEYDEAQDFARRALEIREGQLGDEHALVATSLNSLGNALQNAGELKSAAEVHLRAMRIRETAPEVTAAERGATYHNLGITYYFMRNTALAELYYRRAIATYEGADPSGRLGKGTTHHVLAILYETQRRFEEAIRLEKVSLRMREHVLGADHPHVAYSLTTLGKLYRETGRLEEAEVMLRRAVEIARKAWDPLHAERRWMRRERARTLIALGRFEEAEAALNELIDRLGSADREDSASTSMYVLGDLFAASGRSERAEELFRQAIEIDERVEGAGSRWLLPPLRSLARLLECQRRLDEAAALFDRCVEIVSAQRQSDYPEFAHVLEEAANFFERSDDIERSQAIRSVVTSQWTAAITARRMHLSEVGDLAWQRFGLQAQIVALTSLADRKAECRVAVDELVRMLDSDEASAQDLADASRILLAVTADEPSGRADAIALAERAVARSSRRNPFHLQALVEALRADGRDQDAERVAMEATELLETMTATAGVR